MTNWISNEEFFYARAMFQRLFYFFSEMIWLLLEADVKAIEQVKCS